MNYTPEQEAAIRAASEGKSFALKAVAGGAKTTTGVVCVGASPLPGLALAFNKAIATTLGQKMPGKVQSKTFNGLGHRVWADHLRRKLTLEENKYFELLAQQRGGYKHDDAKFFDMLRAVDLLRNNGYVPAKLPYRSLADDDIIETVEIELDVEFTEDERRQINNVIEQGIAFGLRGSIDFTDQLYLPVICNAYFPRQELLFVDEAQDLNILQHEFIRRMKPTQLIIVGDPHQAIYGWRGADHNSIDNLIEAFRLETLPLTFTFRVPKKPTALAQQIVPHIQCPEWAADGHVVYGEPDVCDVVLCRNNAPLIEKALTTLALGRPVRFKDAKRMDKVFWNQISKITKDHSLPISRFLVMLDDYAGQRSESLRSRGKFGALSRHEDLMNSIRVLTKGLSTVGDIPKRLREMFQGNFGTLYSTIHGAKGLEFKRVHFHGIDLLPSQFAVTDGQLQQEANLRYVAITRTLDSLYLTSTEPF